MKTTGSAVPIRACLRAGCEDYRHHAIPLLVGWAIAVAAVGVFAFGLPANLSLGLQLGAIVGSPALLWAQFVTVRPHLAGRESKASGWRLLGNLSSALVANVIIPTVFRYATFWIWMAVPLSGGPMYAFYSWGIDDMLVAGRLDLLLSAVVVGPIGFYIACGLFFAPLCAVLDGNGPIDAIRRSWRMAGSQRHKILGIAAACFGLPILCFLAAYLLSVLHTGGATFLGVPAILWSVSAVIVVVFSGPWFTGSMAALFVPLKAEEDAYQLRRAERRDSSRPSAQGN